MPGFPGRSGRKGRTPPGRGSSRKIESRWGESAASGQEIQAIRRVRETSFLEKLAGVGHRSHELQGLRSKKESGPCLWQEPPCERGAAGNTRSPRLVPFSIGRRDVSASRGSFMLQWALRSNLKGRRRSSAGEPSSILSIKSRADPSV